MARDGLGANSDMPASELLNAALSECERFAGWTSARMMCVSKDGCGLEGRWIASPIRIVHVQRSKHGGRAVTLRNVRST